MTTVAVELDNARARIAELEAFVDKIWALHEQVAPSERRSLSLGVLFALEVQRKEALQIAYEHNERLHIALRHAYGRRLAYFENNAQAKRGAKTLRREAQLAEIDRQFSALMSASQETP